MADFINKRKFFRVMLSTPICVQMTITEVRGKVVSTGYTNVCVKDIGAGGLSFVSKLTLPVGNDSKYRFKADFFEREYIFCGVVVRKRDIRTGVYEYGIKFTDVHDEDSYLALFNRLQVTVRKLSKGNCCNFCKKKEYPCDLK